MMDDHSHIALAVDTRYCLSSDARLSDARTPAAHKTSHQNGGGDEVATASPAANAIPKAGASGRLASGWIGEAVVSKSVTPTTLALTDEFTVTFATDCPAGDPAFGSAPKPKGAPAFLRDTTLGVEMPLQAYFKSVASSGCVVRVVYVQAQPVSPTAMTMSFAVGV